MKELSVFSKNSELNNILKRFDNEHNSVFYNICYELDFNIGNFIINILPRYIKSKKYPFIDICNLVQRLFLMMSGYKHPSSTFNNISMDTIEVVTYLSEDMYKELKLHDICSDGINWDVYYNSCVDNIKLFSNWDNVLTSYIEEQDYMKEVNGVVQVVLSIPIKECVLINSYYLDILVRNSKTSYDELVDSELLDNFIKGLDLSDVDDIVILTNCIKKEWIKGGGF